MPAMALPGMRVGAAITAVVGLGSTDGGEEGGEDGSLIVLVAPINAAEAELEVELIEDEGSGVVGELG
jgi:hypothetical protein